MYTFQTACLLKGFVIIVIISYTYCEFAITVEYISIHNAYEICFNVTVYSLHERCKGVFFQNPVTLLCIY